MERIRRSLSLGGDGASRPGGEFECRPNTPLSATHGKSGGGAFTFDDFDGLERGGARVSCLSSFLDPRPAGDAMRRTLVRRSDKDKNTFTMVDDASKDFMLCAAKVGDDFFISQCEDFASRPGERYVAVLRLDAAGKQYRLYSRECQCCDWALGVFTCGPQSLQSGDRQCLAEIVHSTSKVLCGHDTSIDCNVVKIKLPRVFSDLSRDCWCARFPKGGPASLVGRGRSKPPASAAAGPREEDSERERGRGEEHKRALKNRAASAPAAAAAATATATAPAAATTFARAQEGGEDDGRAEMVVTSCKPRFDRATGSLRARFLGGRVREASAKNLLWALDKPGSSARDKPASSGKEITLDDDDYVLQFGKLAGNTFSCDIAHPLSVLQGFAVGLSLFAWKGGGPA